MNPPILSNLLPAAMSITLLNTGPAQGNNDINRVASIANEPRLCNATPQTPIRYDHHWTDTHHNRDMSGFLQWQKQHYYFFLSCLFQSLCQWEYLLRSSLILRGFTFFHLNCVEIYWAKEKESPFLVLYLFSYHYHHHHHIVPLARISLTLSRHFILSFIASGRSTGLHPVSSQNCWMYVRAGRPAFARLYAGLHRSTSLMSSSLLLQQCPAYLVRLTCIVFVMGGRWPYSWCLVGCCRQNLFNIARNILV